MRKLDNTNRTRKKNVRHSWVRAGPGIQRCAICGITKQSERYEPIKKGWVTIENNPDTSGFIISSDKCVINGFKAEKNDGDERSILLHIGILSPFNDDPVIIIKQEGI